MIAWVGEWSQSSLQGKSNTNKVHRSRQVNKSSRECDELVFDFRFAISDYQCSIFEFLLFNFRVSSLDVRYSTFEFRCSMRKETRHRKLFDFVCFLLSVYLHYMLILVSLHHLACQILSISTSSATPTATSTLLFYFYIAACGDQSSCPHRCSTYTYCCLWLPFLLLGLGIEAVGI